MDYEFLVDSKPCEISLVKEKNHYAVQDGEKKIEADIELISPHCISILIGNQSHKVYFARDKESWHVYLSGRHFLVREPSREGGVQRDEERAHEGMLSVKAPMPGKVIKIAVSEKEEVRKNQTLAVVEAMKMENEIKSSIEGFVKEIFVSPGDLVDSEKILIELELKEQNRE